MFTMFLFSNAVSDEANKLSEKVQSFDKAVRQLKENIQVERDQYEYVKGNKDLQNESVYIY